jgi:rRNA-processing protein FCF1
MPKYLVEREIPGAGKLSQAQLKQVAEQACVAVQKMGQRLHWIHSYVTGDKTYCVMIAANEEAIREHARQCGLPVTRISEVREMIDPATAGV